LSRLKHDIACEFEDADLLDDLEQVCFLAKLGFCISVQEVSPFASRSTTAEAWVAEVSQAPEP